MKGLQGCAGMEFSLLLRLEARRRDQDNARATGAKSPAGISIDPPKMMAYGLCMPISQKLFAAMGWMRSW